MKKNATRKLALLLTLVLIVTTITSCITRTATSANLDTIASTFVLSDDGSGYILVNGWGLPMDSDGTIEIPSKHEGLPVIAIGEYAFAQISYGSNTSSSYTVIDDNYTVIGDWNELKPLSSTSIIIPNSVKSIGNYAFYGRSDITNITIPNSITSIGDGVFYGCSGLTNITIPKGVTSIGSYAFSDCSGLKSITVASGNPSYHTVNNCLIETQTKRLISVCKGFELPNDGSITAYGEGAFSNANLESVTIPSYITSIEAGAFVGCSKLSQIAVEDGNSIYYSIDNCVIDRDSKVLILGCQSSIIPSDGSVIGIGEGAFVASETFKSITIPDSITDIPDLLYLSLTDVNYSGSCAQWNTLSQASTYGATVHCSDGEYENGLGFTEYTGSMATYSYINGVLIKPCKVTGIGTCQFSDIYINIDGFAVTEIEREAFYECDKIVSVTIPDSVTQIGSHAFYSCPNLASVKLPAKLESIKEATFAGCENLISVIMPKNVNIIEDDAFAWCSSLTSVDIPDGVTSIGVCAFHNCGSLTSITIPTSVTYIGYYAFVSDKLTEITYTGTTAQWYAIQKDEEAFVNNVVIHCTDGDITIKIDW